jgi:rhodanese-related sulfurtransferase
MGADSIIRGFARCEAAACRAPDTAAFHRNFMTFITENWILILVALGSGGMLLWPLVKPGSGGDSVSTTEAVRLINREKGVLIDVSEAAEFAAGHAAGARNLPLGQLEGAKGLPTNKTLPVVVLCPTGTRSGKAVALLRKAGHEKAVALAGGTAAWREASLPIEKTA